MKMSDGFRPALGALPLRGEDGAVVVDQGLHARGVVRAVDPVRAVADDAQADACFLTASAAPAAEICVPPLMLRRVVDQHRR